MEVLKKSDLVKVVAEKLDISQKKAVEAVDAVFGSITEAVAEGKSVRVTDFGVFSVKHKEARTAINPSTMEKVEVPAKNVVTFKAATSLKEGVK